MKRQCRREIWTAILAVAAAGSCAVGVRGDILYQQVPGSSEELAQTFTDTDYADYSTYEFDDFVVDQAGWNVSKITVWGVEDGDPTQNSGVKLALITAADFSLVPTVTIYDGIEDDAGNLVFDNLSLTLDPGATLWITAWVERPFDPGGRWFWSTANDGMPVGSEEFAQNPGGAAGFPSGTAPAPASTVFGTPPADLAFTIEGTVGP